MEEEKRNKMQNKRAAQQLVSCMCASVSNTRRFRDSATEADAHLCEVCAVSTGKIKLYTID